VETSVEKFTKSTPEEKSMSDLLETPEVQSLLTKVSGVGTDTGDARVKRIVHRVVSDLFKTIEEFDVQPNEFWAAVSYLTELGQANEVGLLVPGLGLETFLDLRTDAAERKAGIEGGTPRTIEGPLYVAGAPLSKGEARLDDGSEEGEVLFMDGQVRDVNGKPVADAVVDVWHANPLGGYSFFDPSQPKYNLRRRIETDAEGRYRFRSILPAGYACPPKGPTQKLLDLLGRHGRRPAHIHFFVSAPGYRTLTTQINIDGDEYLHDDFAFATRDGLIPQVRRSADPAEVRARGLNAPFAEITFDFVLHRERAGAPNTVVTRAHAEAA
jgi:catechol 1,2-dioxygenase